MKELTTDNIADSIITLCENVGICDKETATGFRHSKKKYILKSESNHSFSKFTNEINKRQAKKKQETL